MQLDFNQETSEPGYAYPWLRMAKPYAGETYGWHTPLTDGTEVAVAFDMDHSEAVSYEGIDIKTEVQAKTDEKTCENCPPEGKVLPMVRRCSRWSEETINYQTRICETYYNSETQQIQEFKYCGVSFDGWKPQFCQFWEAKARYDQFFRADGRKKEWWTGDTSAIKQAGRHQAVATVNKPLKVVWIFMQPISAKYFAIIFQSMPDIIVHWEP